MNPAPIRGMLLALLLSVSGWSQTAPKRSLEKTESLMPADHLRILQTSADRKELQTSAVALARSPLSADHEQLLGFLRAEEFLARLDAAADYQTATSRRLRLSRVMEAVSTNSAPSARRLIAVLAQDRLWLQNDERIEVLLEASARLRPPPPEVVAFWDKYSQPDDGFTPITITVLVDNGTEPALRLLEKKMASAAHEDGDKIAWMHSRIMPHRNDLPLLESCERMLKESLPEKLRPHLVASLFDYKPGEWFRPASVSTPPDRRLATPPARARLREIGEFALQNLDLPATDKLAVQKALEEIAEPR